MKTAARFLVVTALLLAGCGSPETATETLLREIPPPDLATAEQTVIDQIRAGEARVASFAERAAPAADLAEAYGDLGLVYLTYSFLDASEACFENARSIVDDDFRWPYVLGYLFQIQGRLEEAGSVLSRVLELEPDDPPTLIRLGRIRLETADYEGARRYFERVVALDSNSAAGLAGLGRVAAGVGEPQRAVEYFERALELQPQANSVRYALGLAYRALGDREKARLNLERGGDAPVLFVDPVLQPVARLGRTAELFLVRAAQAFSEERYAQATELYRRALEIDPADFTTHKALGFCLEKLGDLDGAIAQLEEALETATTGDEERDALEHSELFRIMGGLRVLQGRDREAIAAFERSLEFDANRLDSHLKLANALARSRRFAAALEHYDRVLVDLPDNSDVRMKRATLLVNLGRANDAVAEFERAIAADPEDATLRLRFAEALNFLGRGTRAAEQRAVAEGLAAKGDERTELLMAEARALISQGRLEAAVAKLEEVLDQDAGNSDARYEMAAVLGHLGRFERAREEFAQVVKDVPWHRPARHGEVTALLLLERYAEARKRLEDGIAALPRDRGLAHGLARLLASAPVASARDGGAALQLAQQLHAVGAGPEIGATLAMAFAAAGRYEQAVIVQRKLITDSMEDGESGTSESAGESAGESTGGSNGGSNGGSAAAISLPEQRLAAFEARRAWEARTPDEIIRAIASAANPTGPGS